MRKKKIDSPFAKNLRSVMKEKNLSVRKVAALCGLSSSVVQDWLSGTVPHDLQAVARFANSNEARCDFQWLVTGSHSRIAINDLSLSEIFDVEDEPSFSGMFIIEAKRLRRKGQP